MSGDLSGGHAGPGSEALARPPLRGLDRLRNPSWARRMNDAGEQWRSGLLKSEVDYFIGEVERLRGSNAELVGLLARLEWAGGSGCEYAACPDCENLPSSGHARDCELAAAIGAPRKATP